MYPTETYPFFARLDEDVRDDTGDEGLIERGAILTVTDESAECFWCECDDGRAMVIPFALLTPLCRVCDDNPAVGLGVHHPTTLLCTACLEGEPGCSDGEPQCIGCDLAQAAPSEPVWCDHGHQADEIRRLPTGGEGAMLVCRRHYNEEMTYRATSGFASLQKFPTWASLTPL